MIAKGRFQPVVDGRNRTKVVNQMRLRIQGPFREQNRYAEFHGTFGCALIQNIEPKSRLQALHEREPCPEYSKGKHVSDTTDFVSAVGSAISAFAACVAAAGVWYARHQLKTSREIAQLQFEDALGKEYRELAGELSKKALMGECLNDDEYEEAFDELYRYVDLTNEQISLRARGRITSDVWQSWSEGIEANLNLPAFAQAWTEIKSRSKGFEELRRLEREKFKSDPKDWR